LRMVRFKEMMRPSRTKASNSRKLKTPEKKPLTALI
jgi:hypothetical protein